MTTRTINLTLLFIFFFTAIYGQWTTAELTKDRMNIHMVRVGDKLVLAGGSSNGTLDNTVDLYDLKTGVWSSTNLSSDGKEASFGAAAVNGNKAFFAGAQFDDVIDIYDAATDSWSHDRLSEKRNFLAGASVGTKVIFAGGFNHDTDKVSDRIDIYDIETMIWSTAKLSVARSHLSVQVADNRVFFAGGYDEDSLSDIVDIYDAASDSWTTSKISQPRVWPTTIAMDSLVIIAGGMIGQPPIFSDAGSTVVDIYNLNTNTWTTTNLKQNGNFFMRAVVINDRCYIGGGVIENQRGSNILDVYDPGTGEWSTLSLPLFYNSFILAAMDNTLFFPYGLTYNPETEEIKAPNTISMYNLETQEWSSYQTDEQKLVLDVIATKDQIFFIGGMLLDQSTSDHIDIYTSQTVATQNPNIIESLPLAVFPNPAVDVIHIGLTTKDLAKAMVSIYDASGRLVVEAMNQGVHILDVSKLVTGGYYLKIQTTADRQYSTRFVKQ